MNATAAIPETLLALAPSKLRNYRQFRYQGDGLAVDLGTLADRDRELIIHFYQCLNELLYAIADTAADDAQKWAALAAWTDHHSVDRFIDEARELGLASHAEEASELRAKVMHDLRGGALSSLLGRLQMLKYLPRDEEQLKAIFIQTRDHLKIMRNALTGLDDARRERDRAPRAHDMNLMLEKWHESVVGPGSHVRPVRMQIDCHFEGTLTECCMESAAIDRIFYNLANNARRHAADDRLEMVVFPVPAPPESGCLRFVLSNQVSDAGAATLHEISPRSVRAAEEGSSLDLTSLFEPRTSSTGSGFGLTIVADFVTGAFGLRDRGEALREGYVGAVLDGHTFRVWFHWPIASDHLPKKLDDYRRPQESLSEA